MISYLKNTGSISFTVTILPEGKELPGGDQGEIWFWARPEGVRTALSINSTFHLELAIDHSYLKELLYYSISGTGYHRQMCFALPHDSAFIDLPRKLDYTSSSWD